MSRERGMKIVESVQSCIDGGLPLNLHKLQLLKDTLFVFYKQCVSTL